MLRRLLIVLAIALPAVAQRPGARDIRYYFNGREKINLEETQDDRVIAWRIHAVSRIAQRVRSFEKFFPVLQKVGVNGDKLAVSYKGWASKNTEVLFEILRKSGQAQRLRVFRLAGRSMPLIEYPEIYVKLKPGVTSSALKEYLRVKGYQVGNIVDSKGGWAFLDVLNPQDTLPLAEDLNHMPSVVQYAEPSLRWVLSSNQEPPLPPEDPAVAAPQGGPNDKFFPSQWALFKPEGASVLKAWLLPSGPASVSKIVRVAVLDAPIDLSHPDLLPVLEVNNQFNATARLPENQGKLLYHPDPNQRSDHGTACAGIIGAVRGNGIGVAGIASKVRIIPIQIMQETAAATTLDGPSIAVGIRRAVELGADVISMSANTSNVGYVQSIREAMDEIQSSASKQAVFVNSTGNPDRSRGYIASSGGRYSDHDKRTGCGASSERQELSKEFQRHVGVCANGCGRRRAAIIELFTNC